MKPFNRLARLSRERHDEQVRRRGREDPARSRAPRPGRVAARVDERADLLGGVHVGRITIAELGRRVRMPASAARERVRRLEEAGVIGGYAAVVDLERVSGRIGQLGSVTTSVVCFSPLPPAAAAPARVPRRLSGRSRARP